MSKTSPFDTVQSNDSGPAHPRAVIHKRILSVAEDRPGASMDEIAAAVSAASPPLVEQVLEEYGDPGRPPADAAETRADGSAAQASTSDADHDPIENHETAIDDTTVNNHEESPELSIPEPDEVTEKQLETLHAIRDWPNATQATLAERLGVTSATISQRVNSIDGFDWATRRAFVDRFFAQAESAGDEAEAVADSVTMSPEPAEDDTPTNDTAAAASAATSDETDEEAADDDAATDTASAGTPTAAAHSGDTASEAVDRDATENDAPNAAPPTDRPTSPNAEASSQVPAVDCTSTDRAAERGSESEAVGQPTEQTVAALADNVADLTARLERLEGQLAQGRQHTVDPALAHKVLRACFRSDEISAAEEVELVDGILAADSAVVSPPGEASASDSSNVD